MASGPLTPDFRLRSMSCSPRITVRDGWWHKGVSRPSLSTRRTSAQVAAPYVRSGAPRRTGTAHPFLGSRCRCGFAGSPPRTTGLTYSGADEPSLAPLAFYSASREDRNVSCQVARRRVPSRIVVSSLLLSGQSAGTARQQEQNDETLLEATQHLLALPQGAPCETARREGSKRHEANRKVWAVRRQTFHHRQMGKWLCAIRAD